MARIGFDKRAFASFFSLLLFVGLVLGGVAAVSQFNKLRSHAAPVNSPQAIQLVNVTESTASIFWQTQNATTGFIGFGDSVDLGRTKLDDRDRDSGEPQPYQNHIVTISGLTPKTRYYYDIGVDNNSYNRDGSPYIFFTSSSVAGTPASTPLQGHVLNPDHTPANDYFITLTFEDQTLTNLSNTLGAITSTDGSYTVNLQNLRSADGTKLYTLNPTTTYLVNVVILDPFGKNYSQSITYSPKDPFPAVFFGKESVGTTSTTGSVSPLLIPPSTQQSGSSTSTNQLLFGATPTPRTQTPAATTSPVHTPTPKSLKLLL